MEELNCKIDGVVFVNKNTGFFVLKVVVDAGHKHETVRGSIPGIDFVVGMKVRFRGKFENNSTYGVQFNAASCEILHEKGRVGVVLYLSSHVKSIGPVTASRLYDAFGDDLIRILDEDPDQIRSASFLTKPQIEHILKEWKEASASRTSVIMLTDLGLNAAQVKSVLTMFGPDIKQVVESNPYALCACAGIGFQTADNVARKLGIGVDDPRRLRAMILFIIDDLSNDGHMYVTSRMILDHASKIFRKGGVAPFSHGDYFAEASFYAELVSLEKSGNIVSDGTCIYMPYRWEHESKAAEQISAILSNGGIDYDIDSMVSEFEENRKLSLSDDQKTALNMLKKSRICVVSGYPGTGKTTLVSAFVHIFDKMNMDYILMSPTGIASKRLSQVTGKPAYTIHRALGYDKDGQWEFNAANKYTVDAVIVDEMSMVDASTFYHLITALRSTTVVVLVGDAAQLPSVGAGYVLHELMQCSHVPNVSLTRIYRQEGCSDIVNTAHAILRGDTVDTSFRRESEFIFVPMEADSIIDEISKITSSMKSKRANFQVMAPMYDGDVGVSRLNVCLRGVLNDEFIAGKAGKIKHGETDMYEGDRVMVIKNDYDRMIFNGDVGKIQRISIKQDEVEVRIFNWFDAESRIPRYIDKVFTFKVEEARSVLKVAFACTIHKCQGQELDFVVLPMTMKYGVMLYRNLIYTAITRAKKRVFVFGDPHAFQYAIGNIRETVRNSNLAKMIVSPTASVEAA